MDSHQTQLLTANPADLTRAAEMLASGDIVAFPTETVYGLGADACSSLAVAKVYDAKVRPSFNPLIVHVSNTDAAQILVEWGSTAEKLAQAFWPGPMTLVLPLRTGHGIAPLVIAGLKTLAIRVPAHPTAQGLLHAFGGPLAAPSANPSGRISPTTAAHVLAGLDGRIAAVIDGGPCGVGLESTIVGLAGEPVLLRSGGVTEEEIESVLGQPLSDRAADDTVTAPGQLVSHYAPASSVRLGAWNARDEEVFLGFGAMDCDLNLSRSGNLIEAAANLFGHLHQLDALRKPIAVAPVPERGLGRAINDRLRRAAAPNKGLSSVAGAG